MSEAGVPTRVSSNLTAELSRDGLCRILSLDGGGAKGFYTLGVLKEIEGMLGCPLYKRFDLVFGTSTGAIIAALIALGFEVDEIHELYKKYVPEIMKIKGVNGKSQALQQLALKVFGDKKFEAVKTGVGIVTTKWVIERPMISRPALRRRMDGSGRFLLASAVRSPTRCKPHAPHTPSLIERWSEQSQATT